MNLTNDLLSTPQIMTIYAHLTDGYCWFLSGQKEQNRQAKSIIKALIVERIFEYYQVPNIFYLALNGDAEARLIKYLKKLHEATGGKATDETIKQEIEHINTLIDQVIEEIVTKEQSND